MMPSSAQLRTSTGAVCLLALVAGVTTQLLEPSPQGMFFNDCMTAAIGFSSCDNYCAR